MNLPLPRLAANSIALINRLCARQSYFQDENGGSLSITMASNPELKGYRLSALIGSQTVMIDFASAQLQQWLSHILNEACFDSIPDSLQLELLGSQLEPYEHQLKKQFGLMPVLIKLEPLLTPACQQKTRLMLTIKSRERTFCLWVNQGNEPLLGALPQRSNKANQHITLPIWLCLGSTQVSSGDFSALSQGDVIFFDHCYVADQHVIFQLSGSALWRCQWQDHTITILEKENTMNKLHNQESISDPQKLPIELTFDVGHQTVTLEQLGQLQPGYVFELDQTTTNPVSIRAYGKVIGECELVNVNGKLGIRLLTIFTGEQA
ncbi:type III secretion system cytoplasmic ring protein SctQ [Vibrio pacinii]|uniref:type III secretion system cytoplasmic ring protein SctQ n=1 Tax=Vibrio pacinii TaxID=170674 RepID=UPI00056FDA37|nr:type III secretion system cytoplasmic ring protein SctQ [Vibrio pacinii]